MSKAYDDFIERIANHEAFREQVLNSPAEELSKFEFEDEELTAIRSAPAWEWLRAMWKTPSGW